MEQLDIEGIGNLIGTVTEKTQPDRFEENGCQYHMVISTDGYGDIHYDEGGCNCYLYYTRDGDKKPINNLIFRLIRKQEQIIKKLLKIHIQVLEVVTLI